MLRAINMSCFPGKSYHSITISYRNTSANNSFPIALLELPAPQFKLLMDSIIWAIKHTMRDIAEIGLNREYNRYDVLSFLLTSYIV